MTTVNTFIIATCLLIAFVLKQSVSQRNKGGEKQAFSMLGQ